MNIKSLLLGSAAALAAVSGAQAADAIVAAEPEPMEYVRVCDAFGTGDVPYRAVRTAMRSGSGYGTGLNSVALTRLKIAVVAPIPSARVRSAAVVNPGVLRSERNA